MSLTLPTETYYAGPSTQGMPFAYATGNGSETPPLIPVKPTQGTTPAGANSLDLTSFMDFLPDWAKGMFRELLEMGKEAESMSPENAIKTMAEFQAKNKDKIGVVSAEQLEKIVNGELDNINGVKVDDTVIKAAKTYMADNKLLYSLVESAKDGKQDGLLDVNDPKYFDFSKIPKPPGFMTIGPGMYMNTAFDQSVSPSDPEQYFAVRTMDKFMHDSGCKGLTLDELRNIAKGELKEVSGKVVPPYVKEAADIFVRNEGALFKIVESIKDEKSNGVLSEDELTSAVNRLPSGSSPFFDQTTRNASTTWYGETYSSTYPGFGGFDMGEI